MNKSANLSTQPFQPRTFDTQDQALEFPGIRGDCR